MVTIRPMEQTDIPAARGVWQETSGRRADTADQLARYLARNPGLCLVAEKGAELLGVLIGGHDGRRGLLHHVGVREGVRRHGVGRALVDCYLAALKDEGVVRLHLLLRQSNAVGLRFWKAFGCKERASTVVISLALSADANDTEGAE
jgi:ribosomal protein S18 acetylase RimI-like enzyme